MRVEVARARARRRVIVVVYACARLSFPAVRCRGRIFTVRYTVAASRERMYVLLFFSGGGGEEEFLKDFTW